MAEEKTFKSLSTNEGTTYIADEVVAVTAGLAATEVEGVASMSAGFTEGIVQKLGMKNLSQGVKVDVGEENCTIDIYIIINYGARIPDVCNKIREEVKKAVEGSIGLNVDAVNIHVQGISFAEEEADVVEEA